MSTSRADGILGRERVTGGAGFPTVLEGADLMNPYRVACENLVQVNWEVRGAEVGVFAHGVGEDRLTSGDEVEEVREWVRETQNYVSLIDESTARTVFLATAPNAGALVASINGVAQANDLDIDLTEEEDTRTGSPLQWAFDGPATYQNGPLATSVEELLALAVATAAGAEQVDLGGVLRGSSWDLDPVGVSVLEAVSGLVAELDLTAWPAVPETAAWVVALGVQRGPAPWEFYEGAERLAEGLRHDAGRLWRAAEIAVPALESEGEEQRIVGLATAVCLDAVLGEAEDFVT